MLSRAEAVKMAAATIPENQLPRVNINTTLTMNDLMLSAVDETNENKNRTAIMYEENGRPKFVIQSRVRDWSVGGRVIRTETAFVKWSGQNKPHGLFSNVYPFEPSWHSETLFTGGNKHYPLGNLMNHLRHQHEDHGVSGNWPLLFSEEVRNIFNASILVEAVRPTENARKRLRNEVAKKLRREVFLLSERKREYVAAVKILGRRPTTNEVTLVQVMWPAIEPLLDTPVVIEPALRFHMHDIVKRLRPHTMQKAIERAANVTSASITLRAKEQIDPTNVLLPRQWRWLMRQKGTSFRRMTSLSPLSKVWQFALYAEFFPDMRRYGRVLFPFRNELARAAQSAANTDELPEIVRVFLHAVKRHEDGSKNRNAPYEMPLERVKILKALVNAHEAIEMDADLRRANLGTLYELVRDMQLVSMEPEASLKYGRQAFDFPLGGKNLVFEDHEFVPLRDHVMVYEEGISLNHCLFAHMPSMINGDYRAYSVIDLSSEKPVGTLLLRRDSREKYAYTVSQFVEFNNRNLMYEKGDFAQRFVQHVNAGGQNG